MLLYMVLGMILVCLHTCQLLWFIIGSYDFFTDPMILWSGQKSYDFWKNGQFPMILWFYPKILWFDQKFFFNINKVHFMYKCIPDWMQNFLLINLTLKKNQIFISYKLSLSDYWKLKNIRLWGLYSKALQAKALKRWCNPKL